MVPPDVDTVLTHLRRISDTKRGMLEVALAIADEFPAQAHTLLAMIKALTKSADTLLGDTVVS